MTREGASWTLADRCFAHNVRVPHTQLVSTVPGVVLHWKSLEAKSTRHFPLPPLYPLRTSSLLTLKLQIASLHFC